MNNTGMTVREAMKAIAVGDEVGIGTATTVGRKERVTAKAYSNLNKGADISSEW